MLITLNIILLQLLMSLVGRPDNIILLLWKWFQHRIEKFGRTLIFFYPSIHNSKTHYVSNLTNKGERNYGCKEYIPFGIFPITI